MIDEMSAFRDQQLRATLLLERERGYEAHRLSLNELQLQISTLQRENAARQSHLEADQALFAQRKSEQDSRIAEKERAAQHDREVLNAVVQHEGELRSKVTKIEEQINETIAEIERRRAMKVTQREAHNNI
uniref:Mitochondrial division protein 1 n=1 Tax=Lygus hesperus TaxID=30085 RepID=A0A0A9WHQ1_LYGHE